MNSKITGIIVVILIIIGLFFIFTHDSQAPAEIENGETTTTESPSITAGEQTPGDTALVGAVTLSAPGYVVAHKDNEGAPGDVIGNSQVLPSGTSNNISIAVSETLEPNSSFFLMLHEDDGDGVYSFPDGDGPVVDENGNIVTILVETSTDEMVEEDSDAIEETNEVDKEPLPPEEESDEDGDPVEVSYTNSGFTPSSVTIAAGGMVRWTNNSDNNLWVASDVHPTHTLYPVNSAGDCLGSSFDACEGVAPGETWEFVFTEDGSWKYHNHLRANMRGTVVVE